MFKIFKPYCINGSGSTVENVLRNNSLKPLVLTYKESVLISVYIADSFVNMKYKQTKKAEYFVITIRMAEIKLRVNSKCCQGYKAMGTFMYFLWKSN